MSDKPISISIAPGTIVTTILFLLLVTFLYLVRDLVLVVLTAIVIASSIEPATKWFMRFRIPRVLSVLLVYLIVASLLIFLTYFFLPPLLDEASGFVALVPQYLDSYELPSSTSGGVFGTSRAVVESLSLQEVITNLKGVFASTSEGLLRTISAVFGGVLSFMLIAVLSFYFAVHETGIDDFLRIVTPVKHHEYVIDLWKRSQIKIGRYMQGQLILSLIVMILVYLGLTIFGVKYALLLAILAGVFELIPVFGSILAAVPAVIFAFIDGGTTTALLVIGLYVIVNQFQSNLIYPLVVQKIVGVPPLLVILAFIVGAQLAGFLGIILSVPAAAVLQEFVSDIQRQKAALLARESRKT